MGNNIIFLSQAQDDNYGSSDNMIESSNSSFYSSFLKAEGSSGEERQDAYSLHRKTEKVLQHNKFLVLKITI